MSLLSSVSSIRLGGTPVLSVNLGTTRVWSLVSDADALAYISAVEAQDQRPLEAGVRAAINTFVAGCKADGIWPSMKACCLLAGPRTISGALVPLVGPAPTSINFVSADYDRKTGIKGDGVSKSLNTNRPSNSEARSNQHLAAFVSSAATNLFSYYLGVVTGGYSGIFRSSTGSLGGYIRNSSNTGVYPGINTSITGFIGATRGDSSGMTIRAQGSDTFFTIGVGTSATSDPTAVFARNYSTGADKFSSARLGFYSIGSHIPSLGLLEARIAAYINAISQAIV